MKNEPERRNEIESGSEGSYNKWSRKTLGANKLRFRRRESGIGIVYLSVLVGDARRLHILDNTHPTHFTMVLRITDSHFDSS